MIDDDNEIEKLFTCDDITYYSQWATQVLYQINFQSLYYFYCSYENIFSQICGNLFRKFQAGSFITEFENAWSV